MSTELSVITKSKRNCSSFSTHAPCHSQFNEQVLNCSNVNKHDNNKRKMRWIISLGLLFPALAAIIGVIAWAISAEVAMGVKRDSVRKNDASLRFHKSFDSPDDFSVNYGNKRIGDSSKSLVITPENEMMREIHREEQSYKIPTERMIPQSRIYNSEENDKKKTFLLDGEAEEEDEDEGEETNDYEETVKKTSSTTTTMASISIDLDKIRKTLSGTHVAGVIDRLVAQRRALNQKALNASQLVFASTVRDLISKKSKPLTDTSTSSTAIPFSTTTLRPIKSTLKTLNSVRGTTFVKPIIKTTTESSKSTITRITTSKPKRSKAKSYTIQAKKLTSSATPQLSTTIKTTTTRPRSRKVTSAKLKTSPTITTLSTSTARPSVSKQRQRDLEYLMNKVEKLEKQNKMLAQSSERDLDMESSVHESIYNPKSEFIPVRHKHFFNDKDEYIYDQLPHHNDGQQQFSPTFNDRQWSPSFTRGSPQLIHSNAPPIQSSHIPLPPPPTHPVIPFKNTMQSAIYPIGPTNNILQHQMQSLPILSTHPQIGSPNMLALNQEIAVKPNSPLLTNPLIIGEQNAGLINNRPLNNAFKHTNVFNSILPVPNNEQSNYVRNEPNNRAISVSLGDSLPQESRVPYNFERGHQPLPATEDKGVALHIGGGPMGGGGQIMTSPLGIFKTLLLPLMPKPRVNLNGKVVFGVVLENGVGFGKKPKVLAQHYSEGRL